MTGAGGAEVTDGEAEEQLLRLRSRDWSGIDSRHSWDESLWVGTVQTARTPIASWHRGFDPPNFRDALKLVGWGEGAMHSYDLVPGGTDCLAWCVLCTYGG